MNDIRSDCQEYYLTSGGRIWGVQDGEKLHGDSQMRRELLGNSFSRIEDAALIRAKIESWNRIKEYATFSYDSSQDTPSITVKFHFPTRKDPDTFKNDIRTILSVPECHRL